jgi:hypothetical protein
VGGELEIFKVDTANGDFRSQFLTEEAHADFFAAIAKEDGVFSKSNPPGCLKADACKAEGFSKSISQVGLRTLISKWTFAKVDTRMGIA